MLSSFFYMYVLHNINFDKLISHSFLEFGSKTSGLLQDTFEWLQGPARAPRSSTC